MLKSPARKKDLITVALSERIFLKKVAYTIKLPAGGLYTTLKIIFLVWLFIISEDKDSISLQFILKSLRSLYKNNKCKKFFGKL